MKRVGRVAASAVIVSLAVLGSSAAASERADRRVTWTLSFEGFGPLKVGVTVPEAAKALNTKLEEGGVSDPDDPTRCHYASNDKDLPGLALMVINGKIVRVDVRASAYKTAGGAHVGMSERDVRKIYPRIKIEPHHYDPAGHYLVLTTDDKRYSIVFETDGDVVTELRVGTSRAVALVEGCS